MSTDSIKLTDSTKVPDSNPSSRTHLAGNGGVSLGVGALGVATGVGAVATLLLKNSYGGLKPTNGESEWEDRAAHRHDTGRNPSREPQRLNPNSWTHMLAPLMQFGRDPSSSDGEEDVVPPAGRREIGARESAAGARESAVGARESAVDARQNSDSSPSGRSKRAALAAAGLAASAARGTGHVVGGAAKLTAHAAVASAGLAAGALPRLAGAVWDEGAHLTRRADQSYKMGQHLADLAEGKSSRVPPQHPPHPPPPPPPKSTSPQHPPHLRHTPPPPPPPPKRDGNTENQLLPVHKAQKGEEAQKGKVVEVKHRIDREQPSENVIQIHNAYPGHIPRRSESVVGPRAGRPRPEDIPTPPPPVDSNLSRAAMQQYVSEGGYPDVRQLVAETPSNPDEFVPFSTQWPDEIPQHWQPDEPPQHWQPDELPQHEPETPALDVSAAQSAQASRPRSDANPTFRPRWRT